LRAYTALSPQEFTMIRFVLCLLGLLFIQAGVMGQLSNGNTGDFFSNFGTGLRQSVQLDTAYVRRAASFVGFRAS
jgi:hypothetical protein